MTIAGSAADRDGGVVGGVEVSADGGKTWHPAQGRESWTFEWRPTAGVENAVLVSRATDDSLNQETPGLGVRITVRRVLT